MSDNISSSQLKGVVPPNEPSHVTSSSSLPQSQPHDQPKLSFIKSNVPSTSPPPPPTADVATTNNNNTAAAEDPTSTKEMFTLYWFAIHLPNMSMETAKGVTATLVPILIRQLMANMAHSDQNKSAAPSDATAIGSDSGAKKGSSDTFLGIMLAAIGLGTAVFNIPTGHLVRYFNLSIVAASGGLMYCFATAFLILLFGATLWSSSLQPTDADGNPVVISNFSYRVFQCILLTAAILWGMAFSSMSITRLLFVQHRVPKTYRARLMSLVGGAQRWAMVLGPFLAGFVTQHVGMFAAFALHLPLCALNSYCLYRSGIFREVSEEIHEHDAYQKVLSDQRKASRGNSPAAGRSPTAAAAATGGGANVGSASVIVDRSVSSNNNSTNTIKNKAVGTDDHEGAIELSGVASSASPHSMRGLVGSDAASLSDLASVSSPIRLGKGREKEYDVTDLKKSFALSRQQKEQQQQQQQQQMSEDTQRAASMMADEPLQSKNVSIVNGRAPTNMQNEETAITIEGSGAAPLPTATTPSALAVVGPSPPSSSSAIAILNAAPKTEIAPSVSAALEEQQLPSLREAVILHWRILLIVGSYAFIMMFLRSSRTLLLAVNALDLNLPASAVGSVLSLSYAIDATLFFVGGILSDRYGSERIAILATSTLGLSFIALGIPVAPSDIVITDSNNIPLSYYFTAPVMKLILVGLLFGISNSLGSGLVLSLVANHAPKSKGNAILSLMRTVQDAGPLVGPLIAGVMLDGLGFNTTSVLFGLSGILNGLSAWVFMPKPDKTMTKSGRKKAAAAAASAAANTSSSSNAAAGGSA